MSIQQQLNNKAMSYLPLIQSAIAGADEFESNQMYNSALRAMQDSSKAIASMTETELETFQADLITYFKHVEWL